MLRVVREQEIYIFIRTALDAVQPSHCLHHGPKTKITSDSESLLGYESIGRQHEKILELKFSIEYNKLCADPKKEVLIDSNSPSGGRNHKIGGWVIGIIGSVIVESKPENAVAQVVGEQLEFLHHSMHTE